MPSTSLVERGFALLNRAMHPAAATTVRYTRAATVISDALPATFSAPQIELVTAAGASIIGRQFTWRLKRSELQLDGVEVKPERNDSIEWALDGKAYTFTVMPETGAPESGAVDVRSDWVPASVKLTGVA